MSDGIPLWLQEAFRLEKPITTTDPTRAGLQRRRLKAFRAGFATGWIAALEAVLKEAEKEVDTSTINGLSGGSCRTASELLQAIKRIIEELRK